VVEVAGVFAVAGVLVEAVVLAFELVEFPHATSISVSMIHAANNGSQ
jgi:hypothetical protein